MSGLKTAQAEYEKWQDVYKPKFFIEYTHDEYERVNKEYDSTYVWTNHGTCENEQLTNGCQEYSSGCGCWSNFGWWICEIPWTGEAMSIFVDTEYRGECTLCNPDSSDENINPECKECEGSGYIQVYLD